MKYIPCENSITVVFLEGLLKLGNVFEIVKIFAIIESRRPRRNLDDPFGQKIFFSCKYIPDKFLA